MGGGGWGWLSRLSFFFGSSFLRSPFFSWKWVVSCYCFSVYLKVFTTFQKVFCLHKQITACELTRLSSQVGCYLLQFSKKLIFLFCHQNVQNVLQSKQSGSLVLVGSSISFFQRSFLVIVWYFFLSVFKVPFFNFWVLIKWTFCAWFFLPAAPAAGVFHVWPPFDFSVLSPVGFWCFAASPAVCYHWILFY